MPLARSQQQQYAAVDTQSAWAPLYRDQEPSKALAYEGPAEAWSHSHAEPLGPEYAASNTAANVGSPGHPQVAHKDIGQRGYEISPQLEHPSHELLASDFARYPAKELLQAYAFVAKEKYGVKQSTIQTHFGHLNALDKWMVKEGHGDLNDVLKPDFMQLGLLEAFIQHPDTSKTAADYIKSDVNAFRSGGVVSRKLLPQLSERNRAFLKSFAAVAKDNGLNSKTIQTYCSYLKVLAHWMAEEGLGDLGDVKHPGFDQQGMLAAFVKTPGISPGAVRHIKSAVDKFRLLMPQ